VNSKEDARVVVADEDVVANDDKRDVVVKSVFSTKEKDEVNSIVVCNDKLVINLHVVDGKRKHIFTVSYLYVDDTYFLTKIVEDDACGF
jgi:hypothetical protein